MTQSYTTTETWSRTHARKVGGKVVADLRQFQQEYGSPSDAWLEKYLAELTVLLTDDYIEEVTYGFRRNGQWIVAVRYTADMNGNLVADDRSGRIPRGVDVAGATWGSYLVRNAKWRSLSSAERAAIERQLPFSRNTCAAPTDGGPVRWNDKTYSGAGCGVRRSTVGGVL